MDPLPPYARFLGIGTRRSAEGELQFVMPFADVVLGRPGYLHGGAIAGLLEFAAIGAIYEEIGEREGVTVKPINVTVSFMRGGTDHDTFAAATVSRLGNRVANVEAHAWQLDRSRPIASAQMNVLLRRR
ncbi:MAG TPA: PaaI family thioesterase [Allosphingosinicella sp.]|nr:PaaI family thioesterase [Allosphingosinicella sp.]